TASFVPNTPVPGSLAILVNGNKTLTGVRGDDIQLVGQDGGFRFIGVAPLTAYGSNRDTNIQGYHLDESGDVDFAPDQGVNGATNYPITLQMTVAQKEATIVLFKCVGTSLYGMIDPQSMQLLTDLNLYDAQTDSSPQRYGVSAAKIESFQTHVEPAAMLFSERDTSIKVLMGAGPIATRLVMVNFTPWVPKFDSPVARSTIAELKSGKTPDEVAHAVEMLDPAKRTDDDTERLKVVHQY